LRELARAVVTGRAFVVHMPCSCVAPDIRKL
jgi:hypothetical protein